MLLCNQCNGLAAGYSAVIDDGRPGTPLSFEVPASDMPQHLFYEVSAILWR